MSDDFLRTKTPLRLRVLRCVFVVLRFIAILFDLFRSFVRTGLDSATENLHPFGPVS
jgi:hypothetical protein